MYIDSRVAHGRSKYDLGKDERLFRINRAHDVANAIKAVINAASSCTRRRDKVRMLERKAVPALRRLGVRAHVTNAADATMIALYVSHDPVEGIREVVARLDGDMRRCINDTLTAIDPHAVARCMQRNGAQTFEEIETDVLQAIHLTSGIRHLVMHERWRQIGIPGRNGLFVGTVMETGQILLKTYLKPGANGRDSRWSRYQSLFEGMPEFTDDAIRRNRDVGNWMVRHAFDLCDEGPVCNRFPFLTRPYEAVDEPSMRDGMRHAVRSVSLRPFTRSRQKA